MAKFLRSNRSLRREAFFICASLDFPLSLVQVFLFAVFIGFLFFSRPILRAFFSFFPTERVDSRVFRNGRLITSIRVFSIFGETKRQAYKSLLKNPFLFSDPLPPLPRPLPFLTFPHLCLSPYLSLSTPVRTNRKTIPPRDELCFKVRQQIHLPPGGPAPPLPNSRLPHSSSLHPSHEK